MLKSIKTFLALFLIGLQLFAPFIHAHAFGLDTLNERAVHIHASTVDALSTSNIQEDTSLLKQTGYVVTVASGVAPQEASLDFNSSLGIAVFLCFALLLLVQPSVFILHPLPPLFLKRRIEAQRNPRAPPRLLDQI